MPLSISSSDLLTTNLKEEPSNQEINQEILSQIGKFAEEIGLMPQEKPGKCEKTDICEPGGAYHREYTAQKAEELRALEFKGCKK